VDAGYDKVFWTIVDGHVTAFVAGAVLYYTGTGPVKGFAVTLMIGLAASMFTSIVVTRRSSTCWFARQPGPRPPRRHA
jgi:preprotein translocase subunit SecD